MTRGGMRRRVERRAVTWLAFVTAGAAASIQVLRGPVGFGYGWGGALVSAVLASLPLVLLGLAVRGADPRFAWLTMALAAVVALTWTLALAGNWSGQTAWDKALDSLLTVLVLATCAGACSAEAPLLAPRTH